MYQNLPCSGPGRGTACVRQLEAQSWQEWRPPDLAKEARRAPGGAALPAGGRRQPPPPLRQLLLTSQVHRNPVVHESHVRVPRESKRPVRKHGAYLRPLPAPHVAPLVGVPRPLESIALRQGQGGKAGRQAGRLVWAVEHPNTRCLRGRRGWQLATAPPGTAELAAPPHCKPGRHRMHCGLRCLGALSCAVPCRCQRGDAVAHTVLVQGFIARLLSPIHCDTRLAAADRLPPGLTHRC